MRIEEQRSKCPPGPMRPSQAALGWEELSATLQRQSFQHPPPSFSTQLTFKLRHQLPCQTHCDFPHSICRAFPLAQFLLSLPPPHSLLPIPLPKLPLSKSHSQNPSLAGRPCHRWHLGNTRLGIPDLSTASACPEPLPRLP